MFCVCIPPLLRSYGRLVALAPDHSMYRLYMAQALYKARPRPSYDTLPRS